MNQELREENVQLRTQLIHANQTAESLKIELTRRETEIVQLR